MASLQKSAEIILKKCMKLGDNESFLVVYDVNKKKMADVILKEARKITRHSKKIEMPLLKVSGNEPSKDVAKEMMKSDVVVITTTKSISHTKARRDACKSGVRIASMPGITEDMMKRAIGINYEKLSDRVEKLDKILSRAKKIKITNEKGTTFVADITKRKINKDRGNLHIRGNFGNLPAGEIAVAPVEGTSNGIVVFEKSMSGVGKLEKPLKIRIKNGFACDINGYGAEKLKSVLKKSGKNANNIAEIGIGLNDKAKITGAVLEDEKVLGTMHVALGNSLSMGGKIDAKCHLDGIILKPTVYIDGKIVMNNGKLLV